MDLMPFEPIAPAELAGPDFVALATDGAACVVCGPGGHYAHCPAGGCS